MNMATTSIWRVKGNLRQVTDYTENADKTENPNWEGDVDVDNLSDVIDYTTRDSATEKQFYVTGIKCRERSVVEDMNAVKAKYGKSGGVIAYHGYQSFKPGEATPEAAHEIGVALAKEVWGKRYQVLVSTHLDKGHLHNHFVVNTVSYVDGKRYYRSKADYVHMREVSDRLCKEHELSVIHDPKPGRAKQYGEWMAERESKPTWRSIVKRDVDDAIAHARIERYFFDNLHALGYEVKTGKDISVRPPGKERFVRLERNFGEDYSLEGIRKRILAHPPTARLARPEFDQRVVELLQTKSLRVFYRGYMVLMVESKDNDYASFVFKEDLRKFKQHAAQTTLLTEHDTDTMDELKNYQKEVQGKLARYISARQELRNRLRRKSELPNQAQIKAQIENLSKVIQKYRKEDKLCDAIAIESVEKAEKLKRYTQTELGKERQHDKFSGRSRADGKDNARRR
jgi:hypothetical protein